MSELTSRYEEWYGTMLSGGKNKKPPKATEEIGHGSTWQILASDDPRVAYRVPQPNANGIRVKRDAMARLAAVDDAYRNDGARVNMYLDFFSHQKRAVLSRLPSELSGITESRVDGVPLTEADASAYSRNKLRALLVSLSDKNVGIEGKPDDVLWLPNTDVLVVVDYTLVAASTCLSGLERALDTLNTH